MPVAGAAPPPAAFPREGVGTLGEGSSAPLRVRPPREEEGRVLATFPNPGQREGAATPDKGETRPGRDPVVGACGYGGRGEWKRGLWAVRQGSYFGGEGWQGTWVDMALPPFPTLAIGHNSLLPPAQTAVCMRVCI